MFSVSHSITGKKWQIANPDDRLAQALAQQNAIPDVVARIMASRGISIEQAADYLNPTLRLLPDPRGLRDMDKACAILADAISARKTIGILGDYDVDGTTSTAILAHYAQSLGAKSIYHIPNRFTEGYGPSALGFDRLIELGADVIVTVDCGITAHDLLDQYAQKLPIIIIDHHIASTDLPRAAAIINPNRLDDDFPHKYLAACGVVFLTLVGLNRALRERGFFNGKTEPDLKHYLDLVALGTVADIVPLVGVNRIFVRRGLEILAMRNHIGLRALADVARLDGKPDSFHLGFLLGPRINAAGRLQDASLGVQLLLSSEEYQAKPLAQRLDELNSERQSIEQTILAQAMDQVDSAKTQQPVIIASNDNWHPGVIGIVASRLKDRYHRPVCVVAFDKNGYGTGSARSVHGFNLGNAIVRAQQTGLLDKGGGHAMAAGFKLQQSQLPAFQEFLNAEFLTQTLGADIKPQLHIDAVTSVSSLNLNLWQSLNRLAPFGTGNPQPRLALANVQIAYADVMKEKHLRLKLRGTEGGEINAVAFRVMDGPLGPFLLQNRGAQVHIAGQLKDNNFNGRQSMQFIIDDAAAI